MFIKKAAVGSLLFLLKLDMNSSISLLSELNYYNREI